MIEDRRAEVDRKVERTAALARDAGVAGIVITTQHNFAWLTAGRSNRIDASREVGTASLLVSARGRRIALASTIEAPRTSEETVAGLGFELVEYPWTDERADAGHMFKVAEHAIGAGPLGADTQTPHAQPVDGALAKLRATLDPGELPRYRELGDVVGRTLGELVRSTLPGSSERDVARAIAAAFASLDVRPVVLLVAADRRIASYRHPTPTDLRWKNRLLVAVCAEHEGLIVGASRLVSARPDEDLQRRTRATAQVNEALLATTKKGATGAELFEAAMSAYAAAGYPGEERLHHQGGAIAYRAREWVAHPRSADVVTPTQAFAWNPTVTGTKIEETCVLHDDDRLEIVTVSPGWPSIPVNARGQRLFLSDVFVLGA
jgi:Xaa-Pro aminopeptidase